MPDKMEKKTSRLQARSRPLDQARQTRNVEITFVIKAKRMHPTPDSLDELSRLQVSTT